MFHVLGANTEQPESIIEDIIFKSHSTSERLVSKRLKDLIQKTVGKKVNTIINQYMNRTGVPKMYFKYEDIRKDNKINFQIVQHPLHEEFYRFHNEIKLDLERIFHNINSSSGLSESPNKISFNNLNKIGKFNISNSSEG